MEANKLKSALGKSIPLGDGLGAMTNFWCDTCKSIQPAFFEDVYHNDVSETFVGGDILCNKCHTIIATAYAHNATLTSPPLDGL